LEKIEELYHKYKNDVYNFLIYYMKTTDIDDVIQEVFVKALNALNKNVKIENPRSWLITVARHTAIDYIRKQERHRQSTITFQDQIVNSGQQSVEEILQLDEQKKMLLQSIYLLKNSYQEVVILRGFKEFSVAETAGILNWNENKVRITYHRALKKLELLINQGGVISELR
jgi:RNA polymerase sigma-70 factor, ECF subfamily